MAARLKILLRATVLLFLFLVPSALADFSDGKSMDHSAWDAFLKKYVNEAGEVNYQAASKDRSLLDRYMAQISHTDHSILLNSPREEVLAFWLNVYHALAVKLILDHYPVKSIMDIPGVWDNLALTMDKEKISLNQIRNQQLFGNFRDEKMDMVLACTGKSCPGFQREAFTGPKVEGQLLIFAREFVNDARRIEIDPKKKAVKISRIFKWYASDFTLDFGRVDDDRGLGKEFAVISFIANYLEDPDKRDFLDQGYYKIKYFPFDWSLAEWKSEGSSAKAPA